MKPVVILGCTAAGKSDLGEAVAVRLGERAGLGRAARVMAVDSMQVYRGMDIGTAKPSREATERFGYLMVDVVDAWETYSAARFAEQARPFLENSKRETQNTKPDGEAPIVLVGGTILYLRALMEGLFEGPGADEGIRAELNERARVEGSGMLHAELSRVDAVAAGRIHPNDLRRIVRALEVYRLTGMPISTLQTQWAREHPAIESVYIGVRREKEVLNRRINARVKNMVELGLVEEVERLSRDPRGFSEEAASAVGYRQLLEHFARRCSLEEAIEQIKIQTRYLAKMQRTWLKRWPLVVHWIDVPEGSEGNDPAIVDQAMTIIEGQN